VTYLIDEACNVGKGANSIISMLHHFFEVHGLGETSAHLHADNCTGQNKNRFMMYYLMWRCMTGLHDHITISFLLVGHTKFAPDWPFGLMKQSFHWTKIGDLDDIVNCVAQSSFINVPQLVGAFDAGSPNFTQERCLLSKPAILMNKKLTCHKMYLGNHPPRCCLHQ